MTGVGGQRAGVLRGDEFVSTEELLARAKRAATGLAAAGVGRGDAVAALMRNDHPLFELSFATAILGASTVPINWHGKAGEIAYVLTDCKAKALVGHADLLREVPELAGDPARPAIWVPTPSAIGDAHGVDPARRDLPAGTIAWSRWLEQFEPIAADGPASPMSTMVYTSGTTGNPKGVRRTGHRGVVERDALNESLKAPYMAGALQPGMRCLVTGPMYHSAPNAFGLLAARLEGLAVLPPRFDPEQLLALVERHRITHLSLVPTMFVRLLRLPEGIRARYDLSSLEFVSHTAAPCPVDVKRRMIEWWGPIIWESYGATEIGGVTACGSEEWLAHPGTVGRPLPGATVRVYGDGGRPLGPGEVGDIYAHHRLTGDFTYEGNAAARAEVERDGLVTCGDVGYFDADGYLFLCDRKRDMVISGGVNIYPAEIEACLLTRRGVGDCAVYGIPDEEFGESLCAAVEVEPGAVLSVDDVRDHVRSHLAGFKVPKVVVFVDRLPRDDSGKVVKRTLQAAHADRHP